MPSSKTPMIAHISLVRVCRWLRKTEEEPCLPKRRPEPRVPAYAVVGGDRALGGTRRARDSWIGGHSRTPRGLPSRSSWFPRKCHGSLEAEGAWRSSRADGGAQSTQPGAAAAQNSDLSLQALCSGWGA